MGTFTLLVRRSVEEWFAILANTYHKDERWPIESAYDSRRTDATPGRYHKGIRYNQFSEGALDVSTYSKVIAYQGHRYRLEFRDAYRPYGMNGESHYTFKVYDVDTGAAVAAFDAQWRLTSAFSSEKSAADRVMLGGTLLGLMCPRIGTKQLDYTTGADWAERHHSYPVSTCEEK